MVHLTVTFTNLSGTRENFDKTIKELLSDNWVKGNTSNILPNFESDTEELDNIANMDNTIPNVIRVRFFVREPVVNEEWLGDSRHLWRQRLFIECQGESLSVLTLLEDEVNRIIWENAPNSATRLIKSDGSNSEAALYQTTELAFFRIDPGIVLNTPGQAQQDQTPTSEGELIILYYKIKT